MSRRSSVFAIVSALSGSASAAVPVPPASPNDAGAPSQNTPGECVERLPTGKARPNLKEELPRTGTSGHTVVLKVTVEHGKGETVLPGGFRLGLAEESGRLLERSGFFLPDPDGGAGPTLHSEEAGGRVKTEVTIPFVALPEKPGRQRMTLPPVPITIGRASGDVIALCTKPHTLTIEDPIANTPNPEPRRGPEPRSERELWTAAKNAAAGALIALVAGSLVAWLFGRWRKRPKPVPPPPPPRPPWEIALEELFDLKNTGLIREQRHAEYFDRVSDTVRTYLGGRYGFDGLECTTRETLSLLRRVVPPVVLFGDIEAFLRQADLVKFARLTPTEAECEIALERGEHIVRQTIPLSTPMTAALAPDAPTSVPPEPPNRQDVAPPAGGGSA